MSRITKTVCSIASFRPESIGPRPLVLFLHGGGECGNDNFYQMVGTMGAANLAERWPDAFIMAPQAPGGQLTPEEFARMMKSANPFNMSVGKSPDSGKGTRGWNRDYLMRVCQIIRGMIADGLVDRRRVYVTGLSMGGGGTVRILSVDPDLFAAAAPICPSMNGETFMILQQCPQDGPLDLHRLHRPSAGTPRLLSQRLPKAAGRRANGSPSDDLYAGRTRRLRHRLPQRPDQCRTAG